MTREELVVKWGSGERGSAAETADLTLEDMVMAFRQLRIVATRQNNAAVRTNAAILLNAIRKRIRETPYLFYTALESGYPYQESSHYGATRIDASKLAIRLFSTQEKAQTAADAINRHTNSLGATMSGRPEHDIVHVSMLGDYAYGISPMDMLSRFGVDIVMLEDAESPALEVSIPTSALVPKTDPNAINYYALAPKGYAMLCLRLQAKDEGRPLSEQQEFTEAALQQTANAKVGMVTDESSMQTGVNVPETVFVDGVEYLEVYTDWATMLPYYPDGGVVMAVGDWDKVVAKNMPVILNREILLTRDTVYGMGTWTVIAQLALRYIAMCYEVDINTPDGLERSIAILTDIRHADPVCKEFYSIFTITEGKDEQGKTVQNLTVNFPEGNLVTLCGATAKSCYETGLCKSPAAAYHVMALLYNDKDGTAETMFKNAELFE